MEQLSVETVQVKEEPQDYEANFVSELKPDIFDLDDPQQVKVLSDQPPKSEEFWYPVVQMTENAEPEDEGKQESKHSVLFGSLSPHVCSTMPEAVLFVDPADVLDTSSSSVKVEDTDPLSDLKQEPRSSFAGAEQSSLDHVLKDGCCGCEVSTARLTHTCFGRFQHLEIPGYMTTEVHKPYDSGPLESQSSNSGLSHSHAATFGPLQIVPSVEKPSKDTVSTLQIHASGNLGEDCTTSVTRHQDINFQLNSETPYESFTKNSHDSVLSDKTGHHPNKSVSHQQGELSHPIPHLTLHSSNRPYQCSECDKSFTEKNKLNRHLKIHTGERRYQCPECDKKFTEKGNLNEHLRVHTADRPFQCSQCDKYFKAQSSLNSHLRLHTGERPYQCSQCERSFTKKVHLSTHMKIHTGERPYQCSECEKTFTQKGNLNEHLRLHTGDRPYHCSQCDKYFRAQSSFNSHLRLHTGERPYQCVQCERSFTKKVHLNTHLKIHTGERPYQCSDCHKTFSQKGHLDYHLTVHARERAYQCSECNRRFANLVNLNAHLRVHTGERPFHCSHCDKRFTEKSRLNRHLRIHTGERRYQCSECQKKFTEKGNLNEHLKIHTANRPYQCSQCEKCFRVQRGLNRHLRLHTR